MRLIFIPKHQRLVNQCYPTGRTTDKKPKSSETSYLLYYVNSRRSKLEKVSGYLKKRTLSDISSKRRAGNVSVTLELMNKIVMNCKENLNVFIKDFFSIMTSILSRNSLNGDTIIVELIELVFGSICSNIDGTLYHSDVEFISYYSSFNDIFLKLIKEKIKNNDLLLKWCIDISLVAQLSSNPKLNHFVLDAVKITLNQFQEKNPRFRKPNIIENKYTSDDALLSKRLTRTQTRSFGLDNIQNSDSDSSISALQHFFSTTETEKLNISLRGLLDCLQETPNSELLGFICNGVPVQLRYIVILLFMRQLTGHHNHVDPIISLKLMSSLLTSDVSIVGLSVMDLVRKLLEFQMKHINNTDIVNQCSCTLRDIEYKTYYKGQTSDILYDLVARLNSIDRDLNTQDNNSNHNEETKANNNALDEKKKIILIQNLKEITKYKKEQCITIELYIELIPYMGDNIVPLFKLIDKQIPGTYIFSRLYQSIRDLESNELQKVLMKLIFEKYQKYALFSGLKFFNDKTNDIPDNIYYFYHINAANFIGLGDYRTQTEYKCKNRMLFTKEDLLNYYSDAGSNEYSQVGSQILLSKNNKTSTPDLTSDPQNHPIPGDGLESTPTVLPYDQAEVLHTMKLRTERSKNTNNVNNISNNKGSIYRYVSEDTRSLKSMRHKTPKVDELKNAIRNSYQRSKNAEGKRNSVSLKGSQSVKSRVTNITFLLSELKSAGMGSDISKIRDPDEDEIVGLDKIDMARSQTVKLSRHGSNKSTEKRRSFILKKLINDNRNDIKETAEPSEVSESDDFRDATEDVNIIDTRGTLFTTT